MNCTKELINKLPKAELHCHLDGSIRLNTIIELAKKDNIQLPSYDIDKLKNIIIINKQLNSLKKYISKFDIPLSVLQTPSSLKRAAFELAEDCYHDGVIYLELRYSPILHTRKDMKLSETIDAVYLGLLKAEKIYNIKTGIIICGIRSISPKYSYKLAELSIKYKNKGIIGFDLAGEEDNYPAKKHKEAFQLIQDNNIKTTIHAGEAYGPESIAQAIHICGAIRIGHGTRLKEDLNLMKYVNKHKIPLEICLTSNIHTNTIKNLKKHPFKYYLDNNVIVTINTDNRLISDTTLTNEYHKAIKYFNLTGNEVYKIIMNGFNSAFIPKNSLNDIINKINEDINIAYIKNHT